MNIGRFVFCFFCVAVLPCTAQLLSLPPLTVECREGSPGYFILSPVKVGKLGAGSTRQDLILDGKGNFVYLKNYPDTKKKGGLRPVSPGKFAIFDETRFVLLDSRLREYDTIFPGSNAEADPHEFIRLKNGNYAFLACETKTLDLSAEKLRDHCRKLGSKSDAVKCDRIQEFDTKGNLVFEWKTEEHFKLDDADCRYLSDGAVLDWAHVNALAQDADGNYLLSSKFLNEITKIDRSTGKIMWRWGGKKSEINTIDGDGGFLGQHNISNAGGDRYLLFDNGLENEPGHPEAAKLYLLDHQRKIARLEREVKNSVGVGSSGYGSATLLPGGDLLVSFGRSESSRTIFQVMDVSDRVNMKVSSTDSITTYRTYYCNKSDLKISRPKIKQRLVKGKVFLECNTQGPVTWNDGSKENRIEAQQGKTYWVAVHQGGGVWFFSEPVTVSAKPGE